MLHYAMQEVFICIKEKRFYTRGTLRDIMISRLAKTPILYSD